MKSRRDSVGAAVAALAGVFEGDIAPPASVKLRDSDLLIWRAIMRARARDEWSEIDKMHAANLVRCLADVERISEEIAKDGDTLTNERGTRVVNPKHSLLELLSRRAVVLTRLLHLHAGTLVDEPGRLAQRRKTEKEAREAADEMGADDDYLARPGGLQ